ncbi:TIGR01777 family oxidoreductase [Bacteriovoracaceae bacterium]|nr:TIGR01777 family oxidoreductase [Bacteriovoracaceae bacterium]
MKFLITGATGLVGSHLVQSLFEKGYDQVNVLSRNATKAQNSFSFPVKCFEWNPSTGQIDMNCFEGVDVIIHLAGESVAQRWSQSRKDKILNSRVQGTKLIANSIKKLKIPPKKIISTSAIGIYGSRASELLSSVSTPGEGFLADVCLNWEAPIRELSLENTQALILRVGIVLSLKGGALQQMLPPFQAGVAGNLGDGKQYMSWIHIDDLIRQFIFLAENKVDQSIYNGVSPQPETNASFTKSLGRVLRRPTAIPIPSIGLKVLFGEMSEILLNSQRVEPKNFTLEGFNFKFKNLEDALEDLLQHKKNGEYALTAYQWINKNRSEVFNFFSSEKNLERITPKYLKFQVLDKSTPQLEAGTIINYQLSLHGVPMKWKTRINQFEENSFFIDEQIKGPYTKWLHTHQFLDCGQGTLIKDHIVYKIPLGFLGRIFLSFFINKDVNSIFKYRKKSIATIFNN